MVEYDGVAGDPECVDIRRLLCAAALELPSSTR